MTSLLVDARKFITMINAMFIEDVKYVYIYLLYELLLIKRAEFFSERVLTVRVEG